jgi:RimJ/RimL family protein N-acetyltransferase
MLERITKREQVQELFDELQYEDSWYWWMDGAFPTYPKFEEWVRAGDADAIGLFINRFKRSLDQYELLGFSRFTRTNFMHQFAYITVWITPSLRRERALIPYGLIATAEAIDFAFKHYPLRKIYQNIVKDNSDSLEPAQRVFQFEGSLKDHCFFNDRYQDMITLSVSRSDWPELYRKYRKRLEKFY